jgi:hypothetical protein
MGAAVAVQNKGSSSRAAGNEPGIGPTPAAPKRINNQRPDRTPATRSGSQFLPASAACPAMSPDARPLLERN